MKRKSTIQRITGSHRELVTWMNSLNLSHQMSQVSIDEEDKGQLAKISDLLGMLRRVTSPIEIVSPLIHAKIHYNGGNNRS